MRSVRFVSWKIIVMRQEANFKSTITYSLNPIDWAKRYWHAISWACTKAYLETTGQTDKICQGCGEGIRYYVIENPNRISLGDEAPIQVCKGCVLFYDWGFTRKSICMVGD